jgi:phosphoglycerate dehydrogenase-like enzyme
MTTIYIADPNIRKEQVEAIHQALPDGWQVVDSPAGAAAILTEHAAVTNDMIAAAGSRLRLVARLETGAAPIAATSAQVVDLPNTALVGVAEMSVLLIMALSRHLFQLVRQTRGQEWLPERSTPLLTDQKRYTYNWTGLQDFGTLYGKTVGLIGMGIIGRATATRLRALGMKLIYTQRNRMDPDSEAKYGVQWRSLDDLLRESDFVSLHHRFQEGPGGNDKHIGAREFALMKPTAYLVNTARGRLVDEDALIVALRSGQIAGAALDVFEFEPLRPDSPLLELAGDNVILTPHVAGAPLVDAWRTSAEDLVAALQAALEKTPA